MSTSKRRSTSKRNTSGASAGGHRRSDPKSPETPASAAANSQVSNTVFSKEDEIRLLKALLESTTDPDVSVPLGHVSETQIAAKIKRLKERYHKLAKTKSFIKTAHDEEVYQIARLIWGKQAKKPPPLMVKISGKGDGIAPKKPSPEVDLGNFPYLMEQMAANFTGNDFFFAGLRKLGSKKLKDMNEQWEVQIDEEAEFIAKKNQFYQEVEQLMTMASKKGFKN